MPTSTHPTAKTETPRVGADGRCCTEFRFCAVGADAPVRPPELSGFMEIQCEFATFQWADVGIGPYKRPRKTQHFSVSPLQGVLKTAWVGRKNAEFSIPRRRGRCPHRPAGNARFMVVFRRIRVDFPFCAVGADDPVRPPETPVFAEIQCEFATFQWADRVVRPYKGC